MINLLNGIAVIIDDEVDVEKANVSGLIKQIKSENIPCFMSKELPPIEMIRHLGNASFIILDWKLREDPIDIEFSGVRIPYSVLDEDIEDTIKFLKELKTNFFAPIFIFTNEDKASVISKLEENNLFTNEGANFIFVKNKEELKDGNTLFTEIESWIKENQSVYVMKQWEREYQNAKNKLFIDFFSRSPEWPKVLWKSFEDDKMNSSLDLAELIERNLYSRMTPFEFDSALLSGETDIKTEEYFRLLEGTRFIGKEQLNEKDIFTGDLFFLEDQVSWPYRLNIRAQCDLRDSNPELYCLRGRVVDTTKINSHIDNSIIFENGEFREKKNQVIIPFLDNGKIIEFSFRDLKLEKWNKLKSKRTGRLLTPFINKVQQSYSLYFQRIGLPRIPEHAFGKIEHTYSEALVSSTSEHI